jgi:hypothetical protein
MSLSLPICTEESFCSSKKQIGGLTFCQYTNYCSKKQSVENSMRETCPRCGEKHKQPKDTANPWKYCYQGEKGT